MKSKFTLAERAEIKRTVTANQDQCQYINMHHPDCDCDPCVAMVDVECRRPAVGVTREGKQRICRDCAVEIESDPDIDIADYYATTIAEVQV